MWRTADSFDPVKARGKPFSHHAVSILHRRVADWYRTDPEFGSSRWFCKCETPDPVYARRKGFLTRRSCATCGRTIPPTFEPLPDAPSAAARDGFGCEDPESLIDLDALTPAARRTLLLVATRGVRPDKLGAADLHRLTVELAEQGLAPPGWQPPPPPSVETCSHGHAWTPENTDRGPKGHRRCRACWRARFAHEFEAQAV